MADVVRFITNSPEFIMISCENLSGRTDIYVMGGRVHTMPVHPTVKTFGFSIVPQVTSAAGTGARIALPFQNCFVISADLLPMLTANILHSDENSAISDFQYEKRKKTNRIKTMVKMDKYESCIEKLIEYVKFRLLYPQ